MRGHPYVLLMWRRPGVCGRESQVVLVSSQCSGCVAGQDTIGILFHVKVMNLLHVSHHALAGELHPEAFLTHQPQAPVCPDMVVC